jgi:GNAT superfamily N-acetyltransferase
MSTTAVLRVSHVAILCAANARQLVDEYAAECSIPDAYPQEEKYAALEQSGALQCFAAYVDDELIGFASVLSAVMLHNGRRMAALESIFVSRSHRSSGAGNALLSAAEQYAAEVECVGLSYLPRIGSALEKVLLRRSDCEPTHTMYTRWL